MSIIQITQKQKTALEAIYNSIENSGFPPTLAELREDLNVSSNQSVLNFLDALEKKGLIKRERGKNKGMARGIRILPLGFETLEKDPSAPIAGVSAAGPFVESFAESVLDKWMTLPGEVVKNEKIKLYENQVFIIRVFGDSMVNARISDGDFLLIKKCDEFKSGDVVVARTDEGTTVKRFMVEKDGKSAYLKPENPAYKNIPVDERMELDGRIIFNLSKGRKV